MKKKAILYLRVSTDEQAEKGYSLQYQEERLNRYCAINDIHVIAQFKEDHSAKTFNRPEFHKMLTFCKSNSTEIDCLLFINWSRFSRNAGDSYAMISKFQKLGIEPQAIDQPLDLAIPENKMMLAFYLAAPEVENDRRSLNVLMGMRRARKEGRWMATAPMGYKNTRDEHGKPIIVPGPQAELVRMAYQEFARGIYTMEELRLKLRKKGLKCSRNQFPRLLRNPAYIGKIIVPAYKDEEAHEVDGIHEPLITKPLFYQVQDILSGRKPNHYTYDNLREEFPLRGYLICKKCGNNITGSASRGNGGRYHYYHCKCGCKERFRASEANQDFIKLLRSFRVKPEVLDLFNEILDDLFSCNRKNNLNNIKKINEEIVKSRRRISNAQKLMLDGDLSIEEYKEIRTICQNTIDDLTVQLSNLNNVEDDYKEQLKFGISLISDIDKYYDQCDLEIKQLIIGSIFPGKLIYDENKFRTKRLNEFLELICLNDNELQIKKEVLKRNFSFQHHQVNLEGFEPPTS